MPTRPVQGLNASSSGGSSSLPTNTVQVQSGGSIQSAITAASAGTTIIVYPGTYNESLQLKNGVNLHFENGAIVNYSGATNRPVLYDAYYNGSIFVGNASGISCNISGFGQFIQSSPGATNNDMPVVIATRTGTIINLECLSVVSNAGSGPNAAGLMVYGGILKANVFEKIESTFYDAILSAGGIGDGALYVTSRNIHGADDACENGGNADIYIQADTFAGENSAVNAPSGNTYLRAFKVTGILSEDGGNIFVDLPTAVP